MSPEQKGRPGRLRNAALGVVLATIAGLLAFGAPAHAATAAARTPATPATTTVGADSGSVAGVSPGVAATMKGTGPAAQQKALAAYWTPARMKAAIPDGALQARLGHVPTSTPAKPTTTVPLGAPGRVAPAAGKVGTAGGGVTPDAYYPNYPVGAPPAATNGKVYGTYYINGSYIDYQCSATVVNSESKAEVWTAGHCVTESGTWAVNWAFVPNCYNNGAGGCVAPFGVWYAYQLWSKTAYINNNNDLANDVGTAVMYRNSGILIANYLGGQGIEWNYPVGQAVSAFGYPVPSFTGVDLVQENGTVFNFGSVSGTDCMVNYMTPGSSGGAWLAAFNGSYGYINGHNDFKYNAYPQYMCSAYYGDQVGSLFNQVRVISPP